MESSRAARRCTVGPARGHDRARGLQLTLLPPAVHLHPTWGGPRGGRHGEPTWGPLCARWSWCRPQSAWTLSLAGEVHRPTGLHQHHVTSEEKTDIYKVRPPGYRGLGRGGGNLALVCVQSAGGSLSLGAGPHVVQGSKALGHPTALPGHNQGAGWKVQQLGHKPLQYGDTSTCKGRVSQLSHHHLVCLSHLFTSTKRFGASCQK